MCNTTLVTLAVKGNKPISFGFEIVVLGVLESTPWNSQGHCCFKVVRSPPFTRVTQWCNPVNSVLWAFVLITPGRKAANVCEGKTQWPHFWQTKGSQTLGRSRTTSHVLESKNPPSCSYDLSQAASSFWVQLGTRQVYCSNTSCLFTVWITDACQQTISIH